MMKHRSVYNLVIFFSYFALISIGVASGNNNKIIEIQLNVVWHENNRGNPPYFDIVITSISDMNVRALDVRNRPDFVDAYLDVVIVPLSLNFELERSIADPNIIDETDFVQLAPGDVLVFDSIVLPIDYSALVPGTYKAHAVYRIDPINRPNEIYRSEEVIFDIE